jgi:hypothetical protein
MCGLDQVFNNTFFTGAIDKHMKNPPFKKEQSQIEGDSNKMEVRQI